MHRRSAGTVATTLATGLTLALVPSASAAKLDTTFGVGGTSFTPLSAAASDRYLATAPAPAGGTYNGGYTTVSGTNRAFAVSRTTADGRLDPTFGSGGIATVDVNPGPFVAGPTPPAPAGTATPQAAPTGAGEGIRGIATQPDGKIVVLGQAETVQNGSKADSRDTDVYVARFTTNGTLDTTFGTGGVTRIDLSDGRAQIAADATTTTVNGDQAGYDVKVRPDGRLLLTLSKGLDFAEPTRPDREIVIAQLTAAGAPDPTFGVAGLRQVTNPDAGVSENPRRGLLLADGRYVTTAYGPVGGQNRPFLIRVTANGALDTTFGNGGVATAAVAGASGRAEAYSVLLHQDRYAVVGYGQRGVAAAANNGSDVLLFRFNVDGTWDRTFGTDGLVDYDRLNPAGGAANTAAGHFGDNGRDFVVTPDQRLVVAGQSGPDALVLVRNPDGTPDTSVGPDGAIVTDLGGTNDAFWGATLTNAGGVKVVVAGYRGFAGDAVTGDNAALQQVDVTPAAPVVPVTPVVPPTTPAVPVAPVTPAKPTTPTTTTPKPSKTVGKVVVSAKRTGGRLRVSLTVQRFGKGRVSVSAKRRVKGAKAVSGRATLSSKGKLTLRLRTNAKGRYTLTLKVPTPAGGTQTIKRNVTVR